MGHKFVTASQALVLTNSNSRTAPIALTSIVVTPFSEASVSAHATFYNATAATANTEFLSIRCGTAAKTIIWSDPNGMEVSGSVLFVALNCAFATLIWK